MKQKSFLHFFQLLACLALVLQCHFAYGAPGEDFEVGSKLPPFTLPAPETPEAQKYLGLKAMGPFTLSDVSAKVVLIEFMSAVCPHCLANAPVVNKLYKVIQGDAALARKVKVMGVAVSNTSKQLEAYKKKFNVPFPIFPDEGYAITGPMGGVDTPTMMLTTLDGKVLSIHRGTINDFDAYLKELREICKKQ